MKKRLHTRKIRIRKNAPLPPVAVSDRYKDFSKVISTYSRAITEIHKKPLYKNPRLFLGLLLVAVIAGLVFFAMEEEKGKVNLPAQKQNQELKDSVYERQDSGLMQPRDKSQSSPKTFPADSTDGDEKREYINDVVHPDSGTYR